MSKIYIKKVAHLSVKVLLVLCLLIFLPNVSDASGVFYSIQAGTYSLKTLDFAMKHFVMLSVRLNEEDRDSLRIEEGSKYIIVRLGRFKDAAAAEKVLKRVKPLVSDAFILKMKGTDFENVKLLKSYDDKNQEKTGDTKSPTVPSESKEKTKAITSPRIKPGKNEISADKTGPELEDTSENPAKKEQTENPVNKLIEDVAVQFNNREYKKAAELLKKGLEKWPEDPNLHAWYGATMLDAGSPEKAYEEYRKAAELMPDVPDFHAGMGHSLLDSYIDRAKSSVDAFKKALEIDPDNVSALEGIGIVYVSMGKKNLATGIYEHLKEIDKDASERLNQFILWGLDWGELK